MVYLWRIPDDFPEELIGEYRKTNNPNRSQLRQGEVLTNISGKPIVETQARIAELKKYSCLPNSSMAPLVDKALAEFLTSHAPQDVQLVEALVIARDGQSKEFSMLNITSKVFCIDHKASEYTLVPSSKQIMSFRKLAHIEGCLGAHALARDSEYLSHILVSEKVASELIARGFKGVSLQRPYEVTW